MILYNLHMSLGPEHKHIQQYSPNSTVLNQPN